MPQGQPASYCMSEPRKQRTCSCRLPLPKWGFPYCVTCSSLLGLPQVAVTLPDVRGRQEILDLYLAGKPVAPDVDTGACAAWAAGLAGPSALSAAWRVVARAVWMGAACPPLQRCPPCRPAMPAPPTLPFSTPPQSCWRGVHPASAALSWPTWSMSPHCWRRATTRTPSPRRCGWPVCLWFEEGCCCSR